MGAINPIVKSSVTGGIGFFKMLKIFVLILLFGLIFINFIVIVVQEHSVEKGVKYLGYNFLLTTEKLQDESQKIIDRGVIFPNEGSFVHNLWEFLKNFWGLFSAFVIIYGWMWVLAQLFLWFPLADSSKQFSAWIIAIIVFFLLQMLAIAIMTDKSIMTPFTAFKDFFKAILVAIQPLSQQGTTIDKTLNNISDKITNITI
jgi:hypothetical protein